MKTPPDDSWWLEQTNEPATLITPVGHKPKHITAQQRFLAKRAADKREDDKINCDCPGCENCTGMVPGCTCDISTSGLYFHGITTTTEGKQQLPSAAPYNWPEEDIPF